VFTLEKFSRPKQNKGSVAIENSSANHSSHRWHF